MKWWIVIVFLPVFAFAQWSNDPYENTLVSYQAYSPKMVSDGKGGAIIVYWSSADQRLHAQRLDKYGYALWGEDGIVVGGDGIYQGDNFGLYQDGSGGCVVSFIDFHGDIHLVFSEIYAQRIDSSGNKLWGDIGREICMTDSSFPCSPRIILDQEDHYFIIWSYRAFLQTSYVLYGQYLDGDGNAQWQQNGINISGETNYDNLYGSIVTGGLGYALTFWHEEDHRIWGQRIDTGGNFYWGVNGVLLPEYMGLWNSYISDDNAGCVLTGREQLPYNNYVYHTQRLDSMGTLQWGDSGIVISDTCNLNSFRISLARGCGNTYFSWSDDHSGVAQTTIQRMSDDGNKLWGLAGLAITSPDSASSYPVITSSGTFNVIVAYLDQRGPSIRSQKLDSSGTKDWNLENVVISYVDDFPEDKNIITDMAGGAIICWQVYPGLLMAQQISANGNLGEVLAVSPDNPIIFPKEISLLQNYPNPFNPATVLSFTLPVASEVRLSIYDVSGRLVTDLINGWREAGSHQVTFDASGLASGLYLYRIETGDYSAVAKMVLMK